MYLLDTNTVIYYLNAALPANAMLRLSAIIDTGNYVSVFTKMEVLGFPFPSAAHQNVTEMFIKGSIVLPINNDIVDATIALRKTRKMKLPDAIIASTALAHGHTLLSRNIVDFKNISGLLIVDPFSW